MNQSKPSRTWVAEHIARLPRSGIRDFFELVHSMDNVVSLGIGEPDFATPQVIRAATIKALEDGVTKYTSNLGDPVFRREVCRYVADTFGGVYDPTKECIATVGVSEALDLILRAVLRPGDEALYHEPCYVSYATTIAMTHAVPVPVVTREEEDFALRPEAVEAAITPRTRLLLLNFPNNPTGATLDAATKAAIADIAVRHDLLVITDEIYTELSYGNVSPSIVTLPGMRERSVLLAGFSKAFAMTGFRIGYACGPNALIEAMMKIHQYSMLCASSIAQAAAVAAVRHGGPDMLAMREEYRRRRDLIVGRLNAMGLPCFMPDGAFYVFPRITATGLDSHTFARRLLEEKRVAVVPGTAFGACGAGFVRCSYATAYADIEKAMDRMAEFVVNCA